MQRNIAGVSGDMVKKNNFTGMVRTYGTTYACMHKRALEGQGEIMANYGDNDDEQRCLALASYTSKIVQVIPVRHLKRIIVIED